MRGTIQISQETLCPPAMRKEWRWQTQDGQHLRPAVMRTGHLFNTIAMLWHHFMPPEARLYAHKRYRMGDRFTPEYTEEALRVLLTELCARDDMTDFQMRMLRKMHAYFRKRILRTLQIEDQP